MELGKQGSSETSSSEENETHDHHRRRGRHHQQVVVKEETITTSNPSSATTKRFYECSYCKKGFDNAQALGGHMNIHRGAKAKAKQATSTTTTTSSSSIAMTKSNEEYLNPSYGNMGPRGGFYPVLEARSNYHMYFQPSGSIPGQNYGYYNYQYGAEFLVPRPTSSVSNDELWGSNLSLQIGSGGGEENGIGTAKAGEEGEVDLELRLGHHDRY